MSYRPHVSIGHSFTSKAATPVKYRVLQFLGAGGNSEVYLVVAVSGPNQGSLFAFNVLMRVGEAEREQKFRAECTLLMGLRHPAVMHAYDAGDVRVPGPGGMIERPYLVSSYYPATLEECLRGRVTLATKVVYAMQLLSGVNYLASRDKPIVHRDLKPQNIYVSGHACAIGDFGLMKELPVIGDHAADIVFLKESEKPGMPRFYRTPDLVRYGRGQAGLSAKSDVFQLGLVFAKMFCGRNPLKPANDLLDDIELEPLDSVPGKHGPKIRELLERMLVINPAGREDAQDLLDTWDGVLNEVASGYAELDGRVL